MLLRKGLRLDAVLELKVDPEILVSRIATRVAQMKQRGEPLRADDNPEILKQRLASYQAQTAPLVKYYRDKGALRTVDGMASIEEVTSAIGRALADAAFRPASSQKAGGRRKSSQRPKSAGSKAAPAKKGKKAKPATTSRAKPVRSGKTASKAARPGAGKPASAKQRGSAVKKKAKSKAGQPRAGRAKAARPKPVRRLRGGRKNAANNSILRG
jgi:adenylate kinase